MTDVPKINHSATGLAAIRIEAQGLELLAQAFAGDAAAAFDAAVNTILSTSGRAIVSGIGKSGHIARKVAATLSSTGTPALFIHPAEASHGDLGAITATDPRHFVVVAFVPFDDRRSPFHANTDPGSTISIAPVALHDRL